VEIKMIRQAKTNEVEPFSQSFGMWADREIDLKRIRQKSYERRTKSYDTEKNRSHQTSGC